MSSTDVFNAIGDCFYWIFINIYETLGDLPWRVVLVFGFAAFIFWMRLQAKFNKEAESNPNQIK